MNKADYLNQRHERAKIQIRQRELCTKCLQPTFTCYCAFIQKFDPKISFVILIHPIEFRRRIATGRMAHLCLENSVLICGEDYSLDQQVNDIIADPRFYPVLLYPGRQATDLSQISEASRERHFPANQQPVVFVVDGTWNTARKTVYRSKNLQQLPRISFTPPRPSNFRVRQQPAEKCYSTLEAIHYTIELLGPGRGLDLSARPHDGLLQVFNKMVEQQIEYIRESHAKNTHSRHRRPQILPRM